MTTRSILFAYFSDIGPTGTRIHKYLSSQIWFPLQIIVLSVLKYKRL